MGIGMGGTWGSLSPRSGIMAVLLWSVDGEDRVDVLHLVTLGVWERLRQKRP
jgi:hypothetical protein